MARYTGPNNKQARRVGFSILENGKDLKRPYGPGQHGKDRKRKPSNYAIQLQEKQKLRFMYGLSEKQFERLVNESAKMKGVHGENLFILLESRLDNIVYRIGFANTRRGARQLVNHGHITVNGNKVNIPSYLVRVGDVIALKEASRNSGIKTLVLANGDKVVPSWLESDAENFTGKVVALAARSDIDYAVKENLIVEYYSK